MDELWTKSVSSTDGAVSGIGNGCPCLQHDGTGRATRNEGVCSTGCCSGDVGEFNDGKVDVKFGNCEACKTQECTTQACKLRIVVIVGAIIFGVVLAGLAVWFFKFSPRARKLAADQSGQPDMAVPGVTGVQMDPIGDTDSIPVPCSYVGGNGICRRPSLEQGPYCASHLCSMPGCGQPTGSTQSHCNEHGGHRTSVSQKMAAAAVPWGNVGSNVGQQGGGWDQPGPVSPSVARPRSPDNPYEDFVSGPDLSHC